MEEFKSRRDRVKQKEAALKNKPKEAKAENPATLERPVWYKNKKIMVAMVAAAILILGLLAFWLLHDSSSRIEESMRQSREQIQNRTNAIGDGDDKKAALVQLVDALSPVSCKAGFLPVIGEVGERCKGYNESVASYRKNVENLQQLLEYDAYMKNALSDVNADDEVSDYKAEQERLEKIKDTLNEAPHRELVGKSHDDAMNSLASIATLWGELSEVSSEENEEKYNEVSKKLTTAYAALQKNASDLMHVYDASQRAADDSYRDLME